MASRVGSKGQVVIAKEIRDALGIVPGSLAAQRRVGSTVELRFLPPEHHRSLRGILARYVTATCRRRPTAGLRRRLGPTAPLDAIARKSLASSDAEALLDTSFVVRHLTDDPPEMAPRAAEVVDSNRILGLSTVVLAEVWYVLRDRYLAWPVARTKSTTSPRKSRARGRTTKDRPCGKVRAGYHRLAGCRVTQDITSPGQASARVGAGRTR